MKYTNAKSTLVKNLIKETEFENRSRVDELLELEHFIMYGPKGYFSATYFEDLRKKYPNEYTEMYKELKPEEYQRKLDEEHEGEKRKKEEEEFWVRKKEQLEKDEEGDWRRAGGKD